MGENPELVEGRDYTVEDGKWVWSADYLRRRGYCCGSGCRHCPYGRAGESLEDKQRRQWLAKRAAASRTVPPPGNVRP